MKAWWRSVRAAVTSGRAQRGVLYALVALALLLAVKVSVSPQWGSEAAAAAGRFLALFWPGLLLVAVAGLLAAAART